MELRSQALLIFNFIRSNQWLWGLFRCAEQIETDLRLYEIRREIRLSIEDDDRVDGLNLKRDTERKRKERARCETREESYTEPGGKGIWELLDCLMGRTNSEAHLWSNILSFPLWKPIMQA